MRISDWFSIGGIKKEISRIRWPKQKELMKNFGIVLTVTIIFAIIFVGMDAVIGYALRLLES